MRRLSTFGIKVNPYRSSSNYTQLNDDYSIITSENIETETTQKMDKFMNFDRNN